MPEPPLAEELARARAAVLEAGAIARSMFGRDPEVRHKSPDQPVTPADLEVDRTLRRLLLRDRPEDGWLSEESADRPDRLEKRRVWIVDPIDGTRSFIAEIPEFAISVALAVDGAPVLGLVLNPVSGELFRATRGGGAFLETPDDDLRSLPARLHVRAAGAGGGDRPVLLASRSELAAGEFDPFGDFAIEPTGSTAYKLAGIAAGRGDAFLSRGPKSEWDVCAGALIVEEAGGRVSDLNGRPLRFNRPDPRVFGILATAGEHHDALLERVASLPAPERLRGMEPERRRQANGSAGEPADTAEMEPREGRSREDA